MTFRDFYVSPSEFLAGVEKAFLRAYLDEDENLLDKKNWHPEDLAVNFGVIIDSIGAYSYNLIHERILEEKIGLLENEVVGEMDIVEVKKSKKSKDKKGKK